MSKVNAPATLALLMCIIVGCNKESGVSNDSTNSVVANTAAAVSNTWQSTKETGSNVWDTARNTATNAWEGTKETGSNVWEKTKNAFSAGVYTNEVSTNYFGYDYSQKDAFILEAQMSLNDLDQDAASLSNRVASASNSTKADLQPTLQDIKDKRAELGKKYDDIKNASQADWDDVKAAFGKSYHDLRADLKAGWDSVTSKL